MANPGSIQQTVIGSNNIFSATGDVYVLHNQLSPVDTQNRYNLSILLKKVKGFWIEGVLEESLNNVLSLELGKEIQERAVDHPWDSVLEIPNANREVLSRGTTIDQIFDQANRALLILGEPGSGKTITMLELARELISRAENDKEFSQPVPVILNLSTWSHQPLIDWMIIELSARYKIPEKFSHVWIEQNRILPLLDGLDEVSVKSRSSCVDSINQFGTKTGFSGLAISCRLREYTDLPVRLKLNAAISLQPLSQSQVDQYLALGGPRLQSLREAIQSDDVLAALAQSPLMLNIMSLAYQDVSVVTMTSQKMSLEERRHQLFDIYVERMFKRRGAKSIVFSRVQTMKWLGWLAKRMLYDQQTVFLIEQLQPSWLNRSNRWIYVILSRVANGLLVGIGLGLAGGQIGVSVPLGALAGCIGGLVLGITDGLRFETKNGNLDFRTPQGFNFMRVLPSIIRGFVIGSISCLLVCGIYYGLATTLLAGIVVGLIGGVILGPVFGLIFGLRAHKRSLGYDIITVESFKWSWRGSLLGGVTGLIVGSMLGLIIEFVTRTFNLPLDLTFFGPIRGLILGPIFGLVLGLIVGLFAGLSGRRIEEKTRPNQGIHMSLRNAVFTGLGGGIAGAIVLAPFNGSILALGGGFLTVLWYGGMDVIQHYILRLMLWQTGNIAWSPVRFLEFAVDHIFLRRVGGGYIFIHRLLLEHFAELNQTGEASLEGNNAKSH